MDEDWFKIHRRLKENYFLMHDDMAFIVFMKLLLYVGHEKGEYFSSGRELADLFGIKHSTIYKTLKRLESEQIIKQSSKHGKTLITICNWRNYQRSRKQLSKQKVNNGETVGKQSVNTPPLLNGPRDKEEIKNIRNTDFERAIKDFLDMRKAIKKPMTQRGSELLVAQLENLYPDDEPMQIACLHQSIQNSWQGIFPVKEGAIKKSGVQF